MLLEDLVYVVPGPELVQVCNPAGCVLFCGSCRDLGLARSHALLAEAEVLRVEPLVDEHGGPYLCVTVDF